MSNCAKTKKLKFSKMSANDVLQHLFLDFVLYLRGEKIPVLNGEKLEFDVEWNEDGTFKPTEESIAMMFKTMDGAWRRFCKKRFDKEADRVKTEGMFKYAVSEEWNASKKSTSTETESPS